MIANVCVHALLISLVDRQVRHSEQGRLALLTLAICSPKGNCSPIISRIEQDDSYRERLPAYDPSTTLATRLRASVVPGTVHLFPSKQTTASMNEKVLCVWGLVDFSLKHADVWTFTLFSSAAVKARERQCVTTMGVEP